MHGEVSRRRLTWRGWFVQCVLLSLLALHSVGLLHKHSTAADQNACVACQIADSQALDLPDPGTSSLSFLLVLLCLVALRHPEVISGPAAFRLPPSRAPPAFS